jgi:hypothetical protein
MSTPLVESDLYYVGVPREAYLTLRRLPLTLAVYMALVARARWRPGTYLSPRGPVDLGTGQCVFGRDELAHEVGMTSSAVRTAIIHLTRCGFVTVETGNQGTIATVVGFAPLGPTGDAPKSGYTHGVT